MIQAMRLNHNSFPPLLRIRSIFTNRRYVIVLVVIAAILMVVIRTQTDAVGQFAAAQAAAGRSGLGVGLAKVVSFIANNAAGYFHLGDVYMEAQQYQLAADAYQQTLLREPLYPGARYKRARMLFSSGDYTGAVAETSKELERGPTYVRARYLRGLAYSYLGQWDEATADFTMLLSVNPDWPWTKVDLSWAYLAQGKYVEAEGLLRGALTDFPNHPWVLNNLGLALMNQKQFTDADRAFTDALAAAETMTADQFLAAYPLLKESQFSDGKNQLKQAILFNRAVLFERRGELPAAIATYTEVLTIFEQFGYTKSINGLTPESVRQHINELEEKG